MYLRTRRNQIAAVAIAEIVEHAVAVTLQHFRVDVVAAVAQLSNLLGEQLHAVHGITEDNGLVNAQLGKESVQAVYLWVELYVALIRRSVSEAKGKHPTVDKHGPYLSWTGSDAPSASPPRMHNIA